MLDLDVFRLNSELDSTIGALYKREQGKRRWLAWTCEDEFRTKKVYGETRIPEGRYRVTLRTEGEKHERYLRLFGAEFHKGMLWVRDVPGFKWVLMHIGNDDRDTAGCLLVGDEAKNASIYQSKLAYMRIYPPIAQRLVQGDQVWITYNSLDTPPIQ